MNRSRHLPWIVALVVLALAVLPLIAALASHRKQARRAEELLFERSADVVATQVRLMTARQTNWQGGLRMRLSNRAEAPELLLEEMFASGSRMTLPQHLHAVAYGGLDDTRITLRWQRRVSGAGLGETGEDLLARPRTASLLRAAMEKPAQTASVLDGTTLLTAMTVGESARNPHGWLVASWDLAGICADPGIALVNVHGTLSARPFDGAPRAEEVLVEIGEDNATWRLAIARGPHFGALSPRVSERAIALTGGACALLLALLAGFATRSLGLRAALAAEHELVGLKEHLLHAVSHEFRTPLSVILSSAELLENYEASLSPERRATALAQIRHATERMNELVGQALLLSRIEARQFPVEPKPMDVPAFARDLARETETAALSRCPITVTSPESLDATLDPALLRAVLGNLLSNAVKFSPPGHPVHFIIEAGDHLRFLIRDTGSGIAGDDLSRVRGAFFRAASAADTPGTGLGLTIADKCAVLLGGTLAIESGPSGTTATLTI